MKASTFLVIQALMIVAGLFVYDLLRGGAASAPGPVDPVPQVPAGGGMAPPPSGAVLLSPGRSPTQGESAAMRELQMRVTGIEQSIKAWIAVAQSEKEGRERPTGFDVENLPEPSDRGFDEGVINALRTYTAEIRRREAYERRATMARQTLAQAQVSLDDRTTTQVVEALLSFQDSAQALLVGGREQGLQDTREARQDDYERLHREFASRVRSMVPADEAAKILSTRLAQTAGLFRAPGAPPPPPPAPKEPPER